jgi:hypothetical protein
MDQATLRAEIDWIKKQCQAENHYIWRAITAREAVDAYAELRFNSLVKRSFSLMSVTSDDSVKSAIALSLSKLYL